MKSLAQQNFNYYPTNNALLMNFRLSCNAEILLISTDRAYKSAPNMQKCACNVYVYIPTEPLFCTPPSVVGYVTYQEKTSLVTKTLVLLPNLPHMSEFYCTYLAATLDQPRCIEKVVPSGLPDRTLFPRNNPYQTSVQKDIVFATLNFSNSPPDFTEVMMCDSWGAEHAQDKSCRVFWKSSLFSPSPLPNKRVKRMLVCSSISKANKKCWFSKRRRRCHEEKEREKREIIGWKMLLLCQKFIVMIPN